MARIKNTIEHPTRGRLVCRIYDAGNGKHPAPQDCPIDRYTVAFKGYNAGAGHGRTYPYLAANCAPFHPLGFGQYGETKRFLNGKHLGKRVSFDSLPEQVQRFIMQSI